MHVTTRAAAIRDVYEVRPGNSCW